MLSFVLLQYLNSDQTKPCPEIRIYYDIRVHDIERWFPSLMYSELFEEENTTIKPCPEIRINYYNKGHHLGRQFQRHPEDIVGLQSRLTVILITNASIPKA